VKVLFYGRLADSLGPQVQVDAPEDCTVAQLREKLIAEHPEAAGMLRNQRTRAFVSDTLVFDDHHLSGDQTVEFLPPVSGG
jgi:molybdopterin converting factor small subunit